MEVTPRARAPEPLLVEVVVGNPAGGHGASPGPAEGITGRRHRHRGWAAFAALVVLLGGLAAAGPLSRRVERGELRRLEAQWSTAVALDLDRTALSGTLAGLAVPSDRALVTRADRALRAEEARRLGVLEAQVRSDGALGHRLATIRSALEQAVGALRADLLPGRSPRAGAAVNRLSSLMAAGRQALGVTAPPPGSRARLRSAGAALAHLHHYLDSRTGDDLLLVNGATPPRVVEVDRSRVGEADLGLGPGAAVSAIVPRAGFLAVLVEASPMGGNLWRVPLRRGGHPRLLARGVENVLPAGPPDAVWTQDAGSRFREVDGAGRVLLGPGTLRTPRCCLYPYEYLTQVVSVGPYLAYSFGSPGPGVATRGLELWNPANGASHLVARGCADPLAGEGDLLAWMTCSRLPALHVTNLASGLTLSVGDPAGLRPDPVAAFSPNHRWLATEMTNSTSTRSVLALVDTATGRLRLIGGATPDPSQPVLAWSPHGRRVYFLGADQAAPVATYGLGTSDALDLRYHGTPPEPGIVSQPLVVLSAGKLSSGR